MPKPRLYNLYLLFSPRRNRSINILHGATGLHENDTQCTENIVDPNAKHQFSAYTLLYPYYLCQRFRFGNMEIRTRNLEKCRSARKCADRLRRDVKAVLKLTTIENRPQPSRVSCFSPSI